MALWVEILRRGANGDARGARELLFEQLPLALRGFVPSAIGSRRYTGPVPDAVGAFAHKLPSSDAALVRSAFYEFVDRVVDDVVKGVEKPLLLIELCIKHPDSDLDELVSLFPWGVALKRNHEWKRLWVASMLRSIEAAGIEFDARPVTIPDDPGSVIYQFSEIAYAVSSRRLTQTWEDLKGTLHCSSAGVIFDPGAHLESVDYASGTIARKALNSVTTIDRETVVDLHSLGRRLSGELTGLLDRMHRAKPTDGYQGIAWHSVFWTLASDYEGLHLRLETRGPYCDKDQELAAYLAASYRDIVGTSRQIIQRRRRRLYEACDKHIRAAIVEIATPPRRVQPRQSDQVCSPPAINRANHTGLPLVRAYDQSGVS
jgi:hypothetical protein